MEKERKMKEKREQEHGNWKDTARPKRKERISARVGGILASSTPQPTLQ